MGKAGARERGQRPERGRSRALWVSAALFALLMPMFLYMLSVRLDPVPAMRLAIVLGLIAVSVIAAAIIVACRSKSVTRAIGAAQVQNVHRYLGALVTVIIVGHLMAAIWVKPELLLAPTGASRAAWGATFAILSAGPITRWRKTHYKIWRRLHISCTSIGLTLIAAHVLLLNRLIADPVQRAWLVIVSVVVLAVLAERWVWRPTLRLLRRVSKRGTGRVPTLILAIPPGSTVDGTLPGHSTVRADRISTGRHRITPDGIGRNYGTVGSALPELRPATPRATRRPVAVGRR